MFVPLTAIALILAIDPPAAPASSSSSAPQESVVTAPPPPPTTTADPAAASSVITPDRTFRSGESLPQLLSELPGVAVTRFGGLGASAFLSIRGSTWDQVRIYVDGVPLNLASGGQIDLAAIALGSIERIEVYRAMTPISVGTSALGGIVAITTRQPRDSGGEADAGMGSFGTRFGSAGGFFAGGPVRVYAAIHLLDVQGDFPYAWDNGTVNNPADDQTRLRENNQVRQGDAVLRAALALSPTRELQLSVSALARRQGIPGFGTHLDPEARLTTERGIASLTYTGRDDLGPAGRLQLQAYTIVTGEQFWDPPAIISFKPADTHDRTTTFGVTARAARAAAPWLKLAAIADGRAEKFQPRERRDGVDMSGDPSTRLFGAAGAEADAWWERARLGVIPSLRWEGARDVHSGRTAFRQLIPAGDPIFYSIILGRVGLVQRPTPALALKANVGRYARQPSFLELYGDSGFVEGNTDLRPETAFNGDVGASVRVDGTPGSLSFDGALFGAAVRDLIQFQQDAGGRAHPANVGHARILGVEAALDGRLGRHGRLVAQATFTDARDTSDNTGSQGRQLPLRPRFRAYLRPEARAIGVGPLRAAVYADADLTSGNYLDAANFNRLPARLLFGAGASLAWPRGGLRVTASLQNLGNSTISDVTGLPLPGRALFVTLAGDTSHTEERIRP